MPRNREDTIPANPALALQFQQSAILYGHSAVVPGFMQPMHKFRNNSRLVPAMAASVSPALTCSRRPPPTSRSSIRPPFCSHRASPWALPCLLAAYAHFCAYMQPPVISERPQVCPTALSHPTLTHTPTQKRSSTGTTAQPAKKSKDAAAAAKTTPVTTMVPSKAKKKQNKKKSKAKDTVSGADGRCGGTHICTCSPSLSQSPSASDNDNDSGDDDDDDDDNGPVHVSSDDDTPLSKTFVPPSTLTCCAKSMSAASVPHDKVSHPSSHDSRRSSLLQALALEDLALRVHATNAHIHATACDLAIKHALAASRIRLEATAATSNVYRTWKDFCSTSKMASKQGYTLPVPDLPELAFADTITAAVPGLPNLSMTVSPLVPFDSHYMNQAVDPMAASSEMPCTAFLDIDGVNPVDDVIEIVDSAPE